MMEASLFDTTVLMMPDPRAHDLATCCGRDRDSPYEAKERLAEASFNLRKFLTNSMALQKHLSSQEFQHHEMNVTDSPVTYDDESYTKNTLGDKLEVPECVKVLGVKKQWKLV